MSSRRGSFVALLVLLAVVAGLAACPERALAPPEFTDGGLRDLSAFPDLARESASRLWSIHLQY